MATRFVLTVALLMVIAACGALILRGYRRAETCRANLREIYAVLEMYEIENGTLPSLALFPDDPKNDEDSLRVFLESQGVSGDLCLCPTSPRVVRETGLSYLWNVNLNGKKLSGFKDPEWMIVEINALSDQVPAPHYGAYHILYTDGRVEASREPPPELREEL